MNSQSLLKETKITGKSSSLKLQDLPSDRESKTAGLAI
jgi:hypothetical protein